MTQTETVRVLAKGGVISPGDMYKLCQTARESGCDAIGLGSRQEILLSIPAAGISLALDGLVNNALPFSTDHGQQANIVTSYGAMGIFPSTQWLLADTYLDILEQFDYRPRLKINLTDPQQPLVPRFSGELNFIASPYPTFWHLYVQLPPLRSGKLWPVLIGSEDIARLCYAIEKEYFGEAGPDMDRLAERVGRQIPDLTTRLYDEAFAVPRLPFPEYEGFHASGAGYWLGIFRRDYSYPLLFVEELCELALRSKIGKICLTPWKTLLIKDIRVEHRPNWEKLLGVHQINTGHAASELNWQLPDLDQKTLDLKKRLVRELEESECNTTGLSFAIGAQPMPVATSVLISPEPDTQSTFCIRHTADFTRSNARWRTFARQVPAHALAGKLRELCMHYHACSAAPGQAEPDPEPLRTTFVKSADTAGRLYHCTHCLTVYDPQLGDGAAGVTAGTPFRLLPECWVCSLCEARKEDFVLVAELVAAQF